MLRIISAPHFRGIHLFSCNVKTSFTESDRLSLLTCSLSQVFTALNFILILLCFYSLKGALVAVDSPNTHRKKQRVCQEAILQHHVTLQTLLSRQRLLV